MEAAYSLFLYERIDDENIAGLRKNLQKFYEEEDDLIKFRLKRSYLSVLVHSCHGDSFKPNEEIESGNKDRPHFTVVNCICRQSNNAAQIKCRNAKFHLFPRDSGKDLGRGHIQNCPRAVDCKAIEAQGQFWICPRTASFPDPEE